MDKEIKKIIQNEELVVPDIVKQRMNQTLYNLPNKKKSNLLSFPFKYLISGAACIFITIGAIFYMLTNGGVTPSNQPEENKDKIIHDYLYSGESDHWEASLEFFGRGAFFKGENGRTGYESETEEFFRLEYKGDFKEIEGKPISYEYKTSAGGGGGTLAEMYDKTVTNRSGAGNGAMMREDEIVEVTVEWAGRTESFSLQSNSSKDTNWEVTPTFPTPEIQTMSGKRSYLLRGVKGKAVYVDTGDIKAGEPYKTRWLFYGEELEGNTDQMIKLVAVQKDTGQKEILHHSVNGEIGDQRSIDIMDAIHAQTSLHVVMNIPAPGMWRIDAYIENKYITSIVVEVKK
ncbi:hypothetical protein [Cytobacillus sp.]|uniref:hypothetical protein n=1 Tax=Cytobacillus sp. TaxID=2675269 RepID=UPI0028BF14BA|nr:hypothetical protein [Cytobacillus sp.]